MTLSKPICNDTDGYQKFVMPEYQHPCNSMEYNATINAANYEDKLQMLGLNEWPCCNVPEQYVKKGKDSEHTLDEARKSFMSGHSSFSFYCATFLVIYLHVRLSNDNANHTKIVKEGTIVPRTILRCIPIFYFESKYQAFIIFEILFV